MREFYPEVVPYNEGHLKVSDIHEIYYEESGNPSGIPVVFIHGGPGGGTDPSYRRFFSPQKWRIILFDQRGCGKSKPFSELKDNTTWDLVSDMEKIKTHLNIKKWVVFGGSWGSTLALAYGIKHSESCLGFILRGIFLVRHKELQWFYQYGASEIYPDTWAPYREAIPADERHDYISAYYKRLTSSDISVRKAAAKAWSVWEGSTSKLLPDPDFVSKFNADEFADAFSRIECHYFMNKGFFTSDNFLIENIDKIRHLPCHIVQGRYDVVCPMVSAWDLHLAWPEAKLHISPLAGHSALEAENRSKLIQICDDWQS